MDRLAGALRQKVIETQQKDAFNIYMNPTKYENDKLKRVALNDDDIECLEEYTLDKRI